MEISLKEQCFEIVSQLIGEEGPGTALQIEYEELAVAYGEAPNHAVWGEFLTVLQNERN